MLNFEYHLFVLLFTIDKYTHNEWLFKTNFSLPYARYVFETSKLTLSLVILWTGTVKYTNCVYAEE